MGKTRSTNHSKPSFLKWPLMRTISSSTPTTAHLVTLLTRSSSLSRKIVRRSSPRRSSLNDEASFQLDAFSNTLTQALPGRFDSDMSQDFLSYEKYTDTRNDNRHRN